MDDDKEMMEAIAERLKEELNIEEQRLPAQIVEKLFAIEAAEAKLGKKNLNFGSLALNFGSLAVGQDRPPKLV